MEWNPQLVIAGDKDTLRVSATDIASDTACELFLSLKVRPYARVADWRRSYASGSPFPLGDVTELVLRAQELDGDMPYSELSAWLNRALSERRLHRLLWPYVRTAVESVLDAHEAIEADVGPLRLLATNPEVGPSERRLTAWAPLYATEDGTREIRRLRVGTAHEDPSDSDQRWTATAAFVAATLGWGGPVRRVRVVELGAADGTIAVAFDGTPDEATALYRTHARTRASRIVAQDSVTPCSSCGDCKAAGACRSLLPAHKSLGQPTPGIASRSISPTALEKYAICPGQWLLESSLHLPRQFGATDAIARGNAVHRWLEAAHSRDVACSPADLPAVDGALAGVADGVLTPAEYAMARPFLAGHIDICPLAVDGARVVAVEKAFYSWDSTAQVVPVIRPDLIYQLGDRLIIRETKSMQSPPGNRDTAYGRYLQVPFMLVMLASTINKRYGATSGAVELEVLGPNGPDVYAWDTDSGDLARARQDVRMAVQDWHIDQTWDTRPGPHCGWCPVRQWCPDRDAYLAGNAEPTRTTRTQDETPPF